MPKKKPTHLYKLEDISAPDMLTYQFSLTSGEEGPRELRELMYTKITQLLTKRCGDSSTQTRVVLVGCLTHITVQSDHTEARECIVDGVAAAYAEHTASVLTDEQRLTTMVTRTTAEFGCEHVTVSYTTTDGWMVYQPNVSLIPGSPVAAIHDASTQSVVIRSSNPLYRIDEETIGRIIGALRASVAKTADVKRRQRIRSLGEAVMMKIENRHFHAFSDGQIGSSEFLYSRNLGGNHEYRTRQPCGDLLQKVEREPRPIYEKAVPELNPMTLQGWERELLDGYRTTYENKIIDHERPPTIMIGGGYEPIYSPSGKYIYPPGGASKYGS